MSLPSYARYATIGKAGIQGHTGVLEGGEILYMPRGSCHQFENLEDVVSYVIRFIRR